MSDDVSNHGPDPELSSDGHHPHLRVLADGRWSASVTVKGVTRDTVNVTPLSALSSLCTVLADDLAACLMLAYDQAAELGKKREQDG